MHEQLWESVADHRCLQILVDTRFVMYFTVAYMVSVLPSLASPPSPDEQPLFAVFLPSSSLKKQTISPWRTDTPPNPFDFDIPSSNNRANGF